MPLVENRRLDLRSDSGGRLAHLDPSQSLLKRAALLPEPDRSIALMVLKTGAPRQLVAAALGMNAGTVTRRLQRIGARLHDPLVLALLDGGCPLIDEYRQVGIEHFLQGLSTHAIGEKHRISHDRVRRMLSAIRSGTTPASVRQIRGWRREWRNEQDESRSPRHRHAWQFDGRMFTAEAQRREIQIENSKFKI